MNRRLPLKVERWVRDRFVRTRVGIDLNHSTERSAHALICNECQGMATRSTHVGLWRFREVKHVPGCETEFLAQVLEASTPQLMRRWKHKEESHGTKEEPTRAPYFPDPG